MNIVKVISPLSVQIMHEIAASETMDEKVASKDPKSGHARFDSFAQNFSEERGIFKNSSSQLSRGGDALPHKNEEMSSRGVLRERNNLENVKQDATQISIVKELGSDQSIVFGFSCLGRDEGNLFMFFKSFLPRDEIN